jgi:hypothetical protein
MDAYAAPRCHDLFVAAHALVCQSGGQAAIKLTTVEVVLELIEEMTGISEAEADWALEECGLASIGLPVLVGLLNKRFSIPKRNLHIAVVDMAGVDTIASIAKVVDDAIDVAEHHGV